MANHFQVLKKTEKAHSDVLTVKDEFCASNIFLCVVFASFFILCSAWDVHFPQSIVFRDPTELGNHSGLSNDG